MLILHNQQYLILMISLFPIYISIETNWQFSRTVELEFYENIFPRFLSCYPFLRDLNITYNTFNFSFLDHVTIALRTLRCVRNTTRSFPGGSFRSFNRHTYLGSVDMSNFTKLSRLSNLEVLCLPFIRLSTDHLKIFSSLTALSVLTLDCMSQHTDLTILACLTNLNSLSLAEMNEGAQLDSLVETIPRLNKLTLSYRSDITDIHGIAKNIEKFTNLTHLELNECAVLHQQLCCILGTVGFRLEVLRLETVDIEEPHGDVATFRVLSR